MKNLSIRKLLFLTLGATVLISCEKNNSTNSSLSSQNPNSMKGCDLQDYVGTWDFIVNDDPSTLYRGQVHKFNDSILNIHYQPTTAYVFFLQAEVDCDNSEFETKIVPAGNRGTTTIQGIINSSSLHYNRTKILDTPWGKDTTVTDIKGSRVSP